MGRAEHALDEKSRLIVPARFRDQLGPHFVLTIGVPDRCLVLFQRETWEAIRERIDARPVKDASFRSFARLLYGHTEEAACDGQGRLLIPAALRSYAGIEREVVTIGTSTRVEIWAKEKAAQADSQLAPEQTETLAAEIGLY